MDPVQKLASGGPVALKMARGALRRGDESRSFYTRRLTSNAVDALHQKGLSPWPGIWQSFIPKGREWRVTVVGDLVFEVVVLAESPSSSDWRREQFDGTVQFRTGQLPESERTRCLSLVRELGLSYGCIDLIETPDGGLVFLEVNANGQYLWLDEQLQLGIGKAVADLLKVDEPR